MGEGRGGTQTKQKRVETPTDFCSKDKRRYNPGSQGLVPAFPSRAGHIPKCFQGGIVIGHVVYHGPEGEGIADLA